MGTPAPSHPVPAPPGGDISADGLGGPRGPAEASRMHCRAVSVVAMSPARGAEAVQTRCAAVRATRTLSPRRETSAWVHPRENPLPCSGGQESLAPLPVRPVGGTGVTARPPPPRCLPSPWGQDPLGAPGQVRVSGEATGTTPVPLSLSPPMAVAFPGPLGGGAKAVLSGASCHPPSPGAIFSPGWGFGC